MYEKIEEIEYGVASNLQYKLTLDHINPDTDLPLQLTDLHITLYIKNDLSEDALFSITGVYNSTDEAFDFTFTQEQSDLMTPDTWYYGFNVRITDINGKSVHKNTFTRKITKTGAN